MLGSPRLGAVLNRGDDQVGLEAGDSQLCGFPKQGLPHRVSKHRPVQSAKNTLSKLLMNARLGRRQLRRNGSAICLGQALEGAMEPAGVAGVNVT
jgi:hypothetical protein